MYRALSLNSRVDYGQNRGNRPQCGDVSRQSTIEAIHHSFLIIKFSLYGSDYRGRIHISEVGRVKDKYIDSLSNEYEVGDGIDVQVIKFNKECKIYELEIISN